MPNLTTFNFQNYTIRNITINDEPWFVAKDICDAIDIINVSDSLLSVDDDEKRIIRRDDPEFLTIGNTEGQKGGAQSMTLVNESGLYSLVMRSRKPEAKAFRKWVTSEVLPSIRKTGSYDINSRPLTQAEIILASAQQLVAHERTIREHDSRIEVLESENKEKDRIIASMKEELKEFRDEDEYYTAKAAMKMYGYTQISEPEASAVGRKLSSLSREMGYEKKSRNHAVYGNVGLYHIDVIAHYFEDVLGESRVI
jgi:BRO domain protein|nr:MAG TPA: hypothetical protein [Caudoviricetes sp.]